MYYLCEEIDFENRPLISKKKIITQKASYRHEWNFAVCVVTTGGISVPTMNNLGDKL